MSEIKWIVEQFVTYDWVSTLMDDLNIECENNKFSIAMTTKKIVPYVREYIKGIYGDEFSDKEINNSVGGILFKTIEYKLKEEY